MNENLTINAGALLTFNEPGDFFRLMEAAGIVTLRFYRNGAEISTAEGVGEGYAETFKSQQFDKFSIASASTQTLQFVSRLGNTVEYDKPPTGTVTLAGMQGAYTQAQATVTSASTSLLAAKADRRYLLIQNNHATADIFVTLDGSAATLAKGIKIGPGASYEAAGYCPSGQIFAIGSIATQSNVVIVEG